MNIVPRKFYLDDLFDNFIEGDASRMRSDIYEEANIYYIEMEVPGFQKDEIKIEFNNGNLVISAEKNKSNSEIEGRKYIRRERIYGKYTRSFYLGDVDEEHIEAHFVDGILKLVIPKVMERDTKKYIEIK
ncbi:MAG: Hsp20/alpha crystallin family protein [Bacilli bacterium]|jgi:HSP20 family protein|nr:Hsp20/alpha crystallin family protein [Bacilli bacterium]